MNIKENINILLTHRCVSPTRTNTPENSSHKPNMDRIMCYLTWCFVSVVFVLSIVSSGK